MKLYSAILFLMGLLFSCSTQHSHLAHSNKLMAVSDTIQDPLINAMIQPYKERLDSIMNEVIGYSEVDLVRELPEGSLGNFVCDELLDFVKADTTIKVDFCMLNNGGLRIPSIQAGSIHAGQIYELLPFENLLEIIEMKGADCKRLLDHSALEGGVPVSGIRFAISEYGADSILVNGDSFDMHKNYFILTNDYLANGGEEIMKLAVSRYPLNRKLRDTMIELLKEKKKNRQTIRTIKDGRIVKNK